MGLVHWGNTECVDRAARPHDRDTDTCDPQKITCPACRSIHDKAVGDMWEVMHRIPSIFPDVDLEFQVLAKCVHELNRLNAVDKAAASRVTDYLFNRYTGK